MAATSRPPEGLVLDGREHGGTLRRGGAEDVGVGPHFRLPLPVPPTAVGKRKREVPSKIALSTSSESVILLTGTAYAALNL